MRVIERRPNASHAQHAPAGRDESPAAVPRRPGVEHGDVILGVWQVDSIASAWRIRIPRGRDDGRDRVAARRSAELRQIIADGDRMQQRAQAFARERHDGLSLRIPEPAVELDDLRAIVRHHEPRVQQPGERPPPITHDLEHRSDDVDRDVIRELHVPVASLKRGIRTHATGIRPAISIQQPLVILRRHERHNRRAVRHAEYRDFFALQELFHQNLAPLEQRIDRRIRLGERLGDNDPFARGESGRLITTGAPRSRAALCRRCLRVSRRASRRHPGLGEYLLFHGLSMISSSAAA